jgi:hypothetical protein
MRLFLFGIGGTGGRVMEALTFLLASGVELVDAQDQPVEVIPILLDTDKTNKDTLDGASALELYRQLHKKCEAGGRGGFFSTPINPLGSLANAANQSTSKTFQLNYQGVENTTFRDFIGFNQIEDFATQRLLESLYSEENLNDRLTGGFLGNPNVGSVVLSGFQDSADYKLFAGAFNPGDRVFIIGSIFGGTGAAGMPWLLKALRTENANAGAAAAIRTAAIGALMVLPYFKLQEEASSHIDSNVFVTKTKAALSYYAQHVHNFNQVYYIADTAMASYDNHESGAKQSNDAHVIELLGALAVLRFAGAPDAECLPPAGQYYEYAIDADTQTLDFSTIGLDSAKAFAKQLTQLQMLALLDAGHFHQATQKTWARDNGFDKSFFKSADYNGGLHRFLADHYSPWIQQLASNRRAFAPFHQVTNLEDMRGMRRDQTAKKKNFFSRHLSSELLDMKANTAGRGDPGSIDPIRRFLKLWWDVTSNVYDESYDGF